MHTQENSSRVVTKVAPEGSLQGSQIPYIEDLISMEPCTLWGKFLVEEREEWAFSEPQVRACMGQQPGALNSERALQPLPTTGLEEEAAFQSDIQMASASWLLSDGAALTGDTMLLSGLVGAEQNLTQAAEAGFCTDPARNNRKLQPLQYRLKVSAVLHRNYLVAINVALVITIMQSIKWQARLWWTSSRKSGMLRHPSCNRFQSKSERLNPSKLTKTKRVQS